MAYKMEAGFESRRAEASKLLKVKGWLLTPEGWSFWGAYLGHLSLLAFLFSPLSGPAVG